EAADRPACADDCGDPQVGLDLIDSRRERYLLVRPVDGGAVREPEVAVALEDPHGRRMQHRRAQDDVFERKAVVLARLAAAGEERLQRLRGELDDAVVLDAPGPAARQIAVARREHAELHWRGSVCTTTSAISGRSRRIASSISLARACASASAESPPS